MTDESTDGWFVHADRGMAAAVDATAERSLRAEVHDSVTRLLDERRLLLPRPEDEQRIKTLVAERVAAYERHAAASQDLPQLVDPDGVRRRIFDDLFRLGKLQPLLDHPAVEELICNGCARVFVFVDGKQHLVSDLFFDDDEELRGLVKRLLGPLGKRLDASSPMVDAVLPDGSRLNAIMPPASTHWTYVTIRKFLLRAHSLTELVTLGTMPEGLARFLDAAVRAGVNILVSGRTGSGKTTLLNALGAAITDPNERVITIEETAELQLYRVLPNCASLQARPGNVEGAGEIRIRDLVRNALRMRPSRILIGEVRGPEALDLLLALNTGHDGSLATIHGNSPRDALDRLVTLAMMTEERLTSDAVTKMVARTTELVVHLDIEPRTTRRQVTSVFEVTGLEAAVGGAPVITGNDLWSIGHDGQLAWTGIRPRCTAKMSARGIVFAMPHAVGDQHRNSTS